MLLTDISTTDGGCLRGDIAKLQEKVRVYTHSPEEKKYPPLLLVGIGECE